MTDGDVLCYKSKNQLLRTKRYWGNHFWASGYYVDTVGMEAEMMRKHVKYQDDK